MNDGVLRYVINIHNKEENNRVDEFNLIKNFKIYNIYRVPEDLMEWIKKLLLKYLQASAEVWEDCARFAER